MDEVSETERRFTALDFTDFAQEFLRRNRQYQAQHAILGDLLNRDPNSQCCKEMARRWGLMFPDRSQDTGGR